MVVACRKETAAQHRHTLQEAPTPSHHSLGIPDRSLGGDGRLRDEGAVACRCCGHSNHLVARPVPATGAGVHSSFVEGERVGKGGGVGWGQAGWSQEGSPHPNILDTIMCCDDCLLLLKCVG